MKHQFLTGLAVISLIAACSQPKASNQPIDQKLIYLAVRENGYDLFLNNQDGTEEFQLTSQKGFDWGGRWSVAYEGIMHYEQDTAGNFSHRLISTEGTAMSLDFQELPDFIASPDGRFALYTEKVNEKDHVFMQDLATKTATDITPRDAYHGRVQWSPNGEQVLMISDASGSQELHLYSVADGSIRQLTDGEGRAKYASWSPDGQQIAFTREVLEAPKKDHDIYILDLDSKDVSQLTDTPFGEQEISWSPMGDKIAYHGTIDGKDDIYTLDLKTKAVKKITNGQGYHGEPNWIPVYR